MTVTWGLVDPRAESCWPNTKPPHVHSQPKRDVAHIFVKIHVVRHNVDVGVEHFHLSDNFFQDIANARGEDEEGDVVLVEGVEERLVSLPGKR